MIRASLLPQVNFPVVNCYCKIASFTLQSSFEFMMLWKKIGKLKQCHATFKSLLSKAGVVYNDSTNTMDIPEELWPELIRGNAFAKAYKERGEAKWSDLRSFLAYNVSKMEAHLREKTEVFFRIVSFTNCSLWFLRMYCHFLLKLG